MNGNLKLKNSIYFVCFKTYFDSLKGWFSFVPIFVVIKIFVSIALEKGLFSQNWITMVNEIQSVT